MVRSLRLGIVAISLLTSFLPGCSETVTAEAEPTLPAKINPPQTADLLTVETLQSGTRSRTYSVYYDGQPEGKPVVIALHGGGGDGATMATQANLVDKAKREGFVLVLPHGTGRLPGVGTWNAGGCCAYAARENVDDVAFIGRVIEDVEARLETDRSRVYVIGISNGGMLAFRIAGEMPHRIAAVGTVVGAIFADQPQPEIAVPVIMITAAKDEIVPSAGGMSSHRLVKRSQMKPFKSARATAEFWAQVNGCAPGAHQTITGVVRAQTYQDCVAETVHLIIENASNAWPGGQKMRMEGATPSTAINATDALWSFVQNKSR